MSYGPIKPFSSVIASGATLSAEINLAQNWGTVFLEIPTMASNTQFYIQAANSSGGTYRRVKFPSINSSTVGINDFAIPSSATGCFVPIPNGLQYVKVETTATVDSGNTFRFICGL